LIPFLGLPIFIIGFPRPARLWPLAGVSYSASDDSVYYKQMIPEVVKALPDIIFGGQLGDVQPGSFYLFRFESRIIWMQIIERGYGFLTISYLYIEVRSLCLKMVLKGLELQETSCHHVEAGKVDDILGQSGLSTENSTAQHLLNPHFMHTLTPLTSFPVKTYTKSKVIMTGIIDHPDNLQLMTKMFWKTLVWIFKNNSSAITFQWKELATQYVEPDLLKKFPRKWYAFLKGEPLKEPFIRDPVVSLTIACYALVEVYGKFSSSIDIHI
jgi:hypothetical protein